MKKAEIRKTLRAKRRDHVAALPDSMRALMFHRPPGPLLDLIPEDGAIGFYRAGEFEAPTASYARFFFEQGRTIALPRFWAKDRAMDFAIHAAPFEESDCEPGPFGIPQPVKEAAAAKPSVLFVPLLGFTAEGARIGQGGGHYDRWLADHPDTVAIGMAWDAQVCEDLPLEAHDQPLSAVVTPTRLYGPF